MEASVPTPSVALSAIVVTLSDLLVIYAMWTSMNASHQMPVKMVELAQTLLVHSPVDAHLAIQELHVRKISTNVQQSVQLCVKTVVAAQTHLVDLSVSALEDFLVLRVKMLLMSVLVFHHACMEALVLTDTGATCASVEGTGMDKTVRSVALQTVRAVTDSTLHVVSVNKALFSPMEDVVSLQYTFIN